MIEAQDVSKNSPSTMSEERLADAGKLIDRSPLGAFKQVAGELVDEVRRLRENEDREVKATIRRTMEFAKLEAQAAAMRDFIESLQNLTHFDDPEDMFNRIDEALSGDAGRELLVWATKVVVEGCYRDGVEEGIHRYAWWTDGVEQVGTYGTTVKKAIETMRKESPPPARPPEWLK